MGQRRGRTFAETQVRLIVFAASTAVWNDFCIPATCARVTRSMRDTSAFSACNCKRARWRAAAVSAGNAGATKAEVAEGGGVTSATKALPASLCENAMGDARAGGAAHTQPTDGGGRCRTVEGRCGARRASCCHWRRCRRSWSESGWPRWAVHLQKHA